MAWLIDMFIVLVWAASVIAFAIMFTGWDA